MKLLPFFSIAVLTLSSLTASAATPNVLDIKKSITDSAIVYPESFEMDTRKRLESWYLKNYTTSDNRYATAADPEVSDEVIRARLAALPTVIDMPYNSIVRDYIKRYTSKSRAQVAALLGLSHYYMPIFEQALEERGLPLELKYLPVIESGLDPNAVSRHGAAGLWQIMVGTAKGLGLDVTSLVDERRDPYLSTAKAADYLKDLHDQYGDWSLAIAAYNCGPNTVNKAIRRAGGDPKSHDFWSIYQYLSPETRGYVPMFIAANYVMTYYKDHNISPVLSTKPLVTDTVAVPVRLHFNQISDILNIPVDELRILNPQFRADIIPGSADKPYFLILPVQQVSAYIVSEEEIRAHDADKYSRRETAEPGEQGLKVVAYEPATSTPEEQITDQPKEQPKEQSKEKVKTSGKTKLITYTAVEGENLNAIAEKFGVTTSQLKKWNNLRRAAVRPGQQVKIYADASIADSQQEKVTPEAKVKTQEAATATADQKVSPAKNTAKKEKTTNKKSRKRAEKKVPATVTHEVKSGDNLERIAKRNGVTVDQLRKANPGLKGDMIHPGDKITVPNKAASGKSSGKGKGRSKKRRR